MYLVAAYIRHNERINIDIVELLKGIGGKIQVSFNRRKNVNDLFFFVSDDSRCRSVRPITAADVQFRNLQHGNVFLNNANVVKEQQSQSH